MSKQDEDRTIQVIRISEAHKTARVFFVFVFLAVCLWLILDFLKRDWVDIIILLVTLLLGPTGIIAITIRIHRAYVRRNHERIRELERQMDADRTSSDLKSDGTSKRL